MPSSVKKLTTESRSFSFPQPVDTNTQPTAMRARVGGSHRRGEAKRSVNSRRYR